MTFAPFSEESMKKLDRIAGTNKDLNISYQYPKVLREVADERTRQHAKFGEQNWPDGSGQWSTWAAWAEYAKWLCDQKKNLGTLTFLDILWEEVCEAFAEADSAKLRAELIQVAALAVQWIEAIDRRKRNDI